MTHTFKISVAAAAIAACMVLPGSAVVRSEGDSLQQGFVNPPEEARPRVWWHWTGGNVTREGITKDLEWMRRVGIGGAQIADIGMEGGQTVEKKITFFTPEWFEAVRHAAAEAERLDLELSIFSSSGWSLTGGPWVRPEQAMKKLVWSETGVEGPADVELELPEPPSHYGAYADLGRLPGAAPSDTFYRDSVVVAFPTPPD